MQKIKLQREHSYGWAILASTAAFLIALAFEGFGSDLNFWLSWINEFRTGGYAASTANYPPVLLHWLYLGAQLLEWSKFPEPSHYLVKTWSEIPVWFCQIFLLIQVGNFLRSRQVEPYSSPVFWLTAFNPAILLDNPIWGQVDLMVALPLSLAFLSYAKKGKPMWGPFWLALALATKFQAIVFVPLIAGLALRNVRPTLKGLPMALGIFALAFLPFFVVGNGLDSMARAYWGNVGLYPFASYNAANLWQLLVGENYPRDQIIWGLAKAEHFPLKLLTPAGMGLLLFGLCSLWIFWRAYNRGEKDEWRLALFSFVAFFAFSSDMHERYLFSAVPLAALWAAKDKAGEPWYRFFTWVVFINIAFVLTPKGLIAWNLLSLLIVLSVPALLLGCLDIKWASRSAQFFKRYEWSRNWAWMIALFMLFVQVQFLVQTEFRKSKIQVAVGQGIDLAEFKPRKTGENYGYLHHNVSFDDKVLNIGGQNFATGLGAHAPSHLYYQLPEGEYFLTGAAGLAEESMQGGRVQMNILLNGVQVWQSPILQGFGPPEFFQIRIMGPALLEFAADPLEDKNSDHINWVDLHLTRTR